MTKIYSEAHTKKDSETNNLASTVQQALFDAILDSIIVINKYGVIQDINKATEKLFDYSKKELLGENVSILMDADNASKHDSYLDNHIQTGHTKIIGTGRQVVAKKRSGKLFYAFLSIARFEDNGNIMFVGTIRDISDQVEQYMSLEFQALHDDLTGLASRTLLRQKLEESISHCLRTDSQFCILFIDLDDFKPINDEYGHNIGDEVLKNTAKRLKHSFRDGDLCARVGGDEFVILCTSTKDHNHAHMLVEKAQRVFDNPIQVHNHSIPVGASIGIAQFPIDGRTGDELLKYADTTMYEKKRTRYDNQ